MKCVICGNEKFRKLLWFKETSGSGSRSYPLFRCRVCGLIRPNPLPYNEKTKYRVYKTKPLKNGIGSDEYQDYFRHFRHYEKAIARHSIKGSLLDVGCGYGHFLVIARKLGLMPEGVELDKARASFLKGNGFVVHTKEIRKLKARKYDLITMNHVLEHIEELQDFVKDVFRLLKNDGYLMLSVPYIHGIIPRILRTRWYGQGYGQHLNFFSAKSIKKLLEDNGFEIVKTDVFSMDYAPFGIPKIIRKIINSVLAVIVFFGMGDNLFVIAKKKIQKNKKS